MHYCVMDVIVMLIGPLNMSGQTDLNKYNYNEMYNSKLIALSVCYWSVNLL